MRAAGSGSGLPPTAPVPEAVPAPLLSPELAPRLLFPAARAGYGAVLLCAPGLVLGPRAGEASRSRARAVVRCLGARNLAQAVLTLWRPGRQVLAAGAGIDGCHAAAMLALAVADPQLRRAGLTDALAATAFTAAGAAIASARPPR
jgi:hypothetical protein